MHAVLQLQQQQNISFMPVFSFFFITIIQNVLLLTMLVPPSFYKHNCSDNKCL